MPTLSVHVAVIAEASALVGADFLSDNGGDLYLGSTAPDIRNLIGLLREDTHFVGLGDTSGECGIGRCLRRYPAATATSELSGAAKAFILGYLSHLATDQTWIVEVYRPYFGAGSALAGLPESEMLDRALQFELEERERHGLANLEAICVDIGEAEGFAGLGFADDGALRRWRDFVCQALSIDDVRQRFRYFANTFAREGRVLPPNRTEGFVAAYPALAARAFQHVPAACIAGFRKKSIETTAEVFREYIAGDFEALARR